jgi:hypothetical protein
MSLKTVGTRQKARVYGWLPSSTHTGGNGGLKLKSGDANAQRAPCAVADADAGLIEESCTKVNPYLLRRSIC